MNTTEQLNELCRIRLEKASSGIEYISEDFQIRKKPKEFDIFTDEIALYLPLLFLI